MITAEYQKLMQQMHTTVHTFGASGHKDADRVLAICEMFNTKDVLDYGCGKGTLAQSLGFPIQQYDPGVPEFSAMPKPAEFVVANDVLEHIEPEHIDGVLNHIRDLTKKVAMFLVATRPAKKNLPDGRNFHLIIKSEEWWLKKLKERFDIIDCTADGRDMYVIGVPK